MDDLALCFTPFVAVFVDGLRQWRKLPGLGRRAVLNAPCGWLTLAAITIPAGLSR